MQRAVCCEGPSALSISDSGLPVPCRYRALSSHPVSTAEGGAHTRSLVPTENVHFHKYLHVLRYSYTLRDCTGVPSPLSSMSRY